MIRRQDWGPVENQVVERYMQQARGGQGYHGGRPVGRSQYDPRYRYSPISNIAVFENGQRIGNYVVDYNMSIAQVINSIDRDFGSEVYYVNFAVGELTEGHAYGPGTPGPSLNITVPLDAASQQYQTLIIGDLYPYLNLAFRQNNINPSLTFIEGDVTATITRGPCA